MSVREQQVPYKRQPNAVKKLIEEHYSQDLLIPYRRREFAFDAMIREVVRRSGEKGQRCWGRSIPDPTPDYGSATKTEPMRLLLIGHSGTVSTTQAELCASVSSISKRRAVVDVASGPFLSSYRILFFTHVSSVPFNFALQMFVRLAAACSPTNSSHPANLSHTHTRVLLVRVPLGHLHGATPQALAEPCVDDAKINSASHVVLHLTAGTLGGGSASLRWVERTLALRGEDVFVNVYQQTGSNKWTFFGDEVRIAFPGSRRPERQVLDCLSETRTRAEATLRVKVVGSAKANGQRS